MRAGVIALLASCRPAPAAEVACPAMSGVPALRVVVPWVAPEESAHVTATALGRAPRAAEVRLDTATADCRGGACAAGVGLGWFAPDTVAIVVTTRTRRVRHVATPRYDVWYPNGPQCDPAIRSGRVVVAAGP